MLGAKATHHPDCLTIAPVNSAAATNEDTERGRQAAWYVVQCQSHGENRAILNLRRQGFETFCPKVRVLVRHARRQAAALRPLFPGYVFVQLDVARDPWRSVNGTCGVVHIVGYGDRPQPVPNAVMNDLLSRIGADEAIDWTSTITVGQSVTILSGPFVGLVGTLEKLDPSGRVHVLMELLGQSVAVRVRAEALAPAA